MPVPFASADAPEITRSAARLATAGRASGQARAEPAGEARRKNAPAPETAAPHLLNGDLWVEVARSPAEIARHAAAWDDLGRSAVEPNAFFERWMLEPALAAFSIREEVRLVFVYRKGKRQDVPPALVGFFPLKLVRSGLGLVKSYRLWSHDYCFLRTPLVRTGHLVEVLTTFFQWTETSPDRVSYVDLPLIHGEGPFAKALTQVLYQDRRIVYQVEAYNRALLARAQTAEQYIETAMSSHHRQEVRRQERRLAEQGRVEFRSLSTEEDRETWIGNFFRLEDSGWKGDAGTSLRASETTRHYFRAITAAAWERGQLEMLGLFLDDRPIAMKVNFRTGNGSFAFKIAYTEDYARFSPGVQLELENIRRLHARPAGAGDEAPAETQWMDSCAVPNHFMINRLWKDQRTIQHLIVSTGRRRGNLLVGLLPLLRAAKRTARPLATAKPAAAPSTGSATSNSKSPPAATTSSPNPTRDKP